VRHFDATFEVEGLVFPPTSMIYVPLDRGMSVLQLCRWKFSVKADFIHFEVDFYSKKGKFAF